MKQTIEYLDKVKTCAEELKKYETEIEETIKILNMVKKEAKTIFICGNGGSAGTATHMACDLFKIAGLRAISLDDNIPLMTAITNDSGWENLYVDQLGRLFTPGDVLITISVHGGYGSDKAGAWSQNLTKAIDYVKRNNGKTIGLSGFDGGAMKEICDVCIVVEQKSTPLVESFHVIVSHLIAFRLQEGNRI